MKYCHRAKKSKTQNNQQKHSHICRFISVKDYSQRRLNALQNTPKSDRMTGFCDDNNSRVFCLKYFHVPWYKTC